MKGKLVLLGVASVIVASLGFVSPANADTVMVQSSGAIVSPVLDTTTKAILDNAACADPCAIQPTQVLYETKTLAPTFVVEKTSRMVEPTVVIDRQPAIAPVAPIIAPVHRHFLRFGLGNLLDFGLL